MVHIYNGILLSHKKDEIVLSPITWMDLECIVLSRISQTEKENHHVEPREQDKQTAETSS